LNLYKISQTKNDSYDTYDSAIVCAASKAEAKKIHPGGRANSWDSLWDGDWVSEEDVVVKKIGVAGKGVNPGLILASYSAG